ncbi:olfactory receptor 1468-like [Hyla sarda]|uniref:olfactory receptor 1468-like n=1 Tax=Hyla sarda TaxID=327740 RepID=UPI0024C35B07|nr:olfactory receptor 1468-like [Hyla sarda]
MNVLLRLLYRCAGIPTRIPRSFFCEVTSLQVKYIWAHKHSRLAKSILIRRKVEGDLALPEALSYYLAAVLSRVLDAFHGAEDQNPVDSSDDSRDISGGFFYLVPCLHLVDKYRQKMEARNVTTIFLLGFPELYSFRIFFFLFLFVIYLVTICGNLLVISLVSYNKNLHSPMYFFLTQLTASDIILTSDIVPTMLHVVLNNGSTLPLPACFIQYFIFALCEVLECFLLTVMSYDRYFAICKPLHYHSTMTPFRCMTYILLCWILGILVSLVLTANISQLHFCRSNTIDHFFCDINPLIELSCTNVSRMRLLATSMCVPVLLCPFMIVMVSYAYIVHTVLKIQSTAQSQKVFSTCGSHLAVVSIFYGTLMSIYLTPEKRKYTALRKMMSLVYTMVTPLSNPIIYCLRNKDIKNALKKVTSR